MTFHVRTTAFNVLASADTAGRLLRSDMPAHTGLGPLIEEIEQYASAFRANVKSAAGWRMMYYLLATGNGASTLNAETRHRDKEREDGRLSSAMEFYLATEYGKTFMEMTLATTALTQMAALYAQRKAILQALLEEKTTEYMRLTERLFLVRDEVREAQEHYETTGETLADIRETLAEAETRALETQQDILHVNDQVVLLENRSIKIARPLQSISEFRKSLQNEETQAPEIYIVAGTARDSGELVYDRVTMGADGSIAIEKISESEAPGLLKDRGIMVTDMYEHVYHRPDGKGGTELVRMEHGINGELMGRIGRISQDMIGQYMAATGKDAASITTDAASYEAQIRARDALIGESHATFQGKMEHINLYAQTREVHEHAEKTLDEKQEEHDALHKDCAVCHSKLKGLKEQLHQTEHSLSEIAAAHTRLAGGQAAAIDGVFTGALVDEFLNYYKSLSTSRACPAGLAASWIGAAPPANDTNSAKAPVLQEKPAPNC